MLNLIDTPGHVDRIIPSIVERIPPPGGSVDSDFRGFLFDARYVEN